MVDVYPTHCPNDRSRDSHIHKWRLTRGINKIGWIRMSVEILMQAVWIAGSTSKAIHRHESPNLRIHIPRPEIIKSEMTVKELPGIQVFIGGHAAFVKQIPESVVIVGVRDDTALTG